jgi:hypothetical protein
MDQEFSLAFRVEDFELGANNGDALSNDKGHPWTKWKRQEVVAGDHPIKGICLPPDSS